MTRIFSSVRSVLTIATGTVLSAILLSSCLKNHNDGVSTPVAAIMAFNLAPDKSSVGFSLSGSSLSNSPIGYGSYTGNYLSIYPGERVVNTFDFYSQSVAYASTPENFAADKFYSLFFIGVNNNYKNIVVRDDVDSLSSASGKSFVRFVNAIPDSVNALAISLSSNGNPVSQNSAVFGFVSAFTEVNPGEITIAIKNSNNIDTSRSITVEAKKVYTILLTGIQESATTPVEIKYISNGTLSDVSANTNTANSDASVQ